MSELLSIIIAVIVSAIGFAIENRKNKRKEEATHEHRHTPRPMPMPMPAIKPLKPTPVAPIELPDEGQRVTAVAEAQPAQLIADDRHAARLRAHRAHWRRAILLSEILSKKI